MREVRLDLEQAVRAAVTRLAEAARVSPPLEVPRTVSPQPALGEFSTHVVLSFAPALGRQPRKVAEAILGALTLDPGLITRAEVAGAGYLNFFVAPAYWRQVIRVARERGPAFGRSRGGAGGGLVVARPR